jgi:hypothetical protein
MARIELEPEEIVRVLGAAGLAALRTETPEPDRERSLATARTALDALCGLEERQGIDAVWKVLRELERRDLMALTLLMTTELVAVGWAPPPQ